MINRIRFVVLSAAFVAGTVSGLISDSPFAAGADSNFLVFSKFAPELKNYGFVDLQHKWPSHIVAVCWETNESAQLRKVAEIAVEDTWQKATDIQFTGWGSCADSQQGIRIAVIDDTRAPDSKIGTDLDKLPGGMRLNFTFVNWGQSCQKQIETCIRNITVHEFGHALGFLHESRRPDAPQECKNRRDVVGDHSLASGEKLTEYDPDSVMNYCNEIWLNNGNLSLHDKQAAVMLYGAPQRHPI